MDLGVEHPLDREWPLLHDSGNSTIGRVRSRCRPSQGEEKGKEGGDLASCVTAVHHNRRRLAWRCKRGLVKAGNGGSSAKWCDTAGQLPLASMHRARCFVSWRPARRASRGARNPPCAALTRGQEPPVRGTHAGREPQHAPPRKRVRPPGCLARRAWGRRPWPAPPRRAGAGPRQSASRPAPDAPAGQTGAGRQSR